MTLFEKNMEHLDLYKDERPNSFQEHLDDIDLSGVPMSAVMSITPALKISKKDGLKLKRNLVRFDFDSRRSIIFIHPTRKYPSGRPMGIALGVLWVAPEMDFINAWLDDEHGSMQFDGTYYSDVTNITPPKWLRYAVRKYVRENPWCVLPP